MGLCLIHVILIGKEWSGNLKDVDLYVNIGGIGLKNPVLVSSGTFGYGVEFSDFFDLNVLGGIVTKSITFEPRIGNAPPRMIETASGCLNSIGLENVGVKVFVERKLPALVELIDRNIERPTSIIVNVAGSCVDDYVKVVEYLSNESHIDGFELNISCPNVKEGGMAFGIDGIMAGGLVNSVRQVTYKPLIVKLSPNVTDIVDIAKSVVDSGADVISLVNTFRGMAIDINRQKPVLGNIVGGLSGRAIKPLALYNVYQVALNVNAPIIGMGGIFSGNDAIEFMLAGADAIMVGTANLIRPATVVQVIKDIEKYCWTKGIKNICSLVGRALYKKEL